MTYQTLKLLLPETYSHTNKSYNFIKMAEFNQMQEVKRHFFALRNGIIADTIRKAGYNYKIVFGLNIPQLREIAATIGKNEELALTLRQNVTTRESLLIAPMIFPAENLTTEEAEQWAAECQTTEVADVLCHALLRHLSDAESLAKKLLTSDSEISQYTGLRLLLNIHSPIDEKISEFCKNMASKPGILRFVANQLLEDSAM